MLRRSRKTSLIGINAFWGKHLIIAQGGKIHVKTAT